MTLTLHVLSLPHTQLNHDYISCAYTQKARNFARMMMSLGHKVYTYSSEDIDIEVTENITIASKADQERWFGKFDYHQNFYPITWGPNDPHWVESNNNAIREIGKRIQPGDFICVIAGLCQQAIANAFPSNPTVEYGIGYTGTFANFKVYESYSHMHHVYGMGRVDDGGFYDAVIPNYFDPADFTPTAEKSDYYVFLGRFIRRKGLEIAVEATRKLGAKLIMAGQGCRQEGNKFIGEDIAVEGDHLEHIGHVGVKERAELLANAKACFMPTIYIEPFGGVSIEALFSGTPVIATDYGAFTETIPHGIAGYRFRTIGEAAYYASPDMLEKLSSDTIAEYANANFSLDAVRWKYDDYFHQIKGLYDGTSDFYGSWHGRDDRYSRVLPASQT